MKEEADIVFRVSQTLADSAAIVQNIADILRVLCASQSYILNSPKIERLIDLRAHKALMFNGLQSQLSWLLRHEEIEELVSPNVTVKTNNSFVLKRVALHGLGIVFLPKVIDEKELASTN